MAARRQSPPSELTSIHVPLGITLASALKMLRELERPIRELDDDERSFQVDTRTYSVAVYPVRGKIGSVWYSDSLGRESPSARRRKVRLYLNRYGKPTHWKKRRTNGWMDYWFNAKDKVAMVYGLHMDVIRINTLDP